MTIEIFNKGLRAANEQATQALCPRASVGAVIMDVEGHIIGEGFNKNAFGDCDCDCGTPSNQVGSSTCKTIHAEVMALLSVENKTDMEILATNRPPCYRCLNVLANTEITIIVTTSEWLDRDSSQIRWEELGRFWIII